MSTKSVIVKDKKIIPLLLSTLNEVQYCNLYSEIMTPRRELKTLRVGQILNKTDRLVFYREVVKWSDAYSYNERTINLNPNIYWFLREYNISTVVMFAEDNRKTVVADLEQFQFVSRLGSLVQRRAKLDDLHVIDNSMAMNIKARQFVKSVFAPYVDEEMTHKVKAKNSNSNQGGLFD